MEATCGGDDDDDEWSGESRTATRMSEFECEEVGLGLGLGRVNVIKREGVRVSKVDASIITTTLFFSYIFHIFVYSGETATVFILVLRLCLDSLKRTERNGMRWSRMPLFGYFMTKRNKF
jgi:hypothetical protein